jgi:hypothetical protein
MKPGELPVQGATAADAPRRSIRPRYTGDHATRRTRRNDNEVRVVVIYAVVVRSPKWKLARHITRGRAIDRQVAEIAAAVADPARSRRE